MLGRGLGEHITRTLNR